MIFYGVYCVPTTTIPSDALTVNGVAITVNGDYITV